MFLARRTDRPLHQEGAGHPLRAVAGRGYGAKVVIAKIDRLSRDAHFLLGQARCDGPRRPVPPTSRRGK